MKRYLLIFATALSLACVSAAQQTEPPLTAGNASTRHASRHHHKHHHGGNHGKHHKTKASAQK